MTWRPLPGRSEEPMPRRLEESLDRLARRLGTPGADAVRTVFGRWAEIVGPEAASRSRPLRLAGGVLVVGVGEPGAATELRYRSGDILARVAEVAGGPVAERLEVRVRPRR